jgi:hypothetical protein
VAPRGGEDELQPVHEQRPVRQPRERVVVREELDARFGFLPLADVAHDAHAHVLALVGHHAPGESTGYMPVPVDDRDS